MDAPWPAAWSSHPMRTASESPWTTAVWPAGQSHATVHFTTGDHPIPRGDSARAAVAIGELVQRIPAGADVHVALSGGGSALIAGPLPGADHGRRHGDVRSVADVGTRYPRNERHPQAGHAMERRPAWAGTGGAASPRLGDLRCSPTTTSPASRRVRARATRGPPTTSVAVERLTPRRTTTGVGACGDRARNPEARRSGAARYLSGHRCEQPHGAHRGGRDRARGGSSPSA